jgi:hypothetical protein
VGPAGSGARLQFLRLNSRRFFKLQILEILMSDDKAKFHGQDRERININQDYELRDWAKSLNSTPERVKEAVQAVGDRAEKVREYLKGDKPTG